MKIRFQADADLRFPVLIPQELPYHDTIERLIRLWATTEAETWLNVLFFLPR